jgi:polyisoprenyl-phosphate glycosyltransferase
MKNIEIVVPLLNEFEVIEELLERIYKTINQIDNKEFKVQLVIVDDGSSEEFKKILKKHKELYNFKLIELSRNFGHQTALRAGIENSNADALICMDGDLQDPPEIIPEMIKAYNDGYEIVSTIRKKREKESFVKKITASIFYRVVASNSKINLTLNSGDFKLISSKLINIIKLTNEDEIYLRGLVDWYGGKTKFINYDRNVRFAGKRKYKYSQSLDLAINALVSFSNFFPNFLLKLLSISIFIFFGLIVFLIYSILNNYDELVRGWSSIITLLIFINIIQIFGFFFVTIYLKKIFHQTSGKKPYNITDIS